MPILAVDLGGTKTLAALVDGAEVRAESRFATDREAGPDAWLAAIAEVTGDWTYDATALTVTGRVADGLWTSLNPRTLDIPGPYPLADRAEAVLGQRPFLVNDAQAAAFGEYRHGAGRGEDMIFLTVSTGLGGGIVTGGRLWSGANGLAGHFGQMRAEGDAPLETRLSGTALRQRAADLGHDLAAPEILALAAQGESWAQEILTESARALADLCCDLQLLIDPRRIVIGGGLGLAPGYLDLAVQAVAARRTPVRPDLHPAAMRDRAGIIGAAALASEGPEDRVR